MRAVPSQEQIVGVLGSDGGALCKDPASALRQVAPVRPAHQWGHGAREGGLSFADSRVFKGQLLVIQIYCPNELAEFQQMVEQLKTAGVAGG